jgi:hypothetical protein
MGREDLLWRQAAVSMLAGGSNSSSVRGQAVHNRLQGLVTCR